MAEHHAEYLEKGYSNTNERLSDMHPPARKRRKSNSGSETTTGNLSRSHLADLNQARLLHTIASGIEIPIENDCIHECGPTALHIIKNRPDEVLQLAHQKLHTWPYREVPDCWRRLYEEASLHKVSKLLKAAALVPDVQGMISPVSSTSPEGSLFDQTVHLLDMAIFLSGAPGRKALIDSAFEQLSGWSHYDARDCPSRDGIKYKTPDIPKIKSPHPIQRLSYSLDLESFQTHLDTKATPIIIPGQLEAWPAMEKWKDPQHLLDLTLQGRRLVPIEIGRSYTDEGWTQSIVRFGDFLHEHLIETPAGHSPALKPNKNTPHNENPNKAPNHPNPEPPEPNPNPNPNPNPTAYLAQHDLFTQLPTLHSDILTPDLCYTVPPPPTHPTPATATVPTLEAPLLNAWLGPPGTQSPLHTDPYHNILAQVVGWKFVRLYAPGEGAKLYPRGKTEAGVEMGNTSSVDVSGEVGRVLGRERGGGGRGHGGGEGVVDSSQWPLFGEAGFQEAVLGPGECLYIPVGWWHYVESLSTSFSVSFWWN
ncbi:hypothetical protein MBLNU230_g7762t1 [Neophaeotheca triangularis]